MTKAHRNNLLKIFIPAIIIAIGLIYLIHNSKSSSDASIDGNQKDSQSQTEEVPVYGYKVIASYPHDPSAFTQGLFYSNGYLYESTGLFGSSSLRKVELKTGKTTEMRNLKRQYFAEGITEVDDRIIQLTWRSGVGFIYDVNDFTLINTFQYEGEGWGVTYNGRNIIMSNGSHTLAFLNPNTYRVIGTLNVMDNETPVKHLNELEFINGEIYANVWRTDKIAIIDPHMGKVRAWIDLEGLLTKTDRSGYKVDVLNGIAYNSDSNTLYVTGKNWPKLYEIEVVKNNK